MNGVEPRHLDQMIAVLWRLTFAAALLAPLAAPAGQSAATLYALNCMGCHQPPDEAKQVASRIQAGTVWINQHGMIHPMVPFGGIKGSGYGVEFGLDGLKAVTQPQVISIKK